jgi:hypothetical protein
MHHREESNDNHNQDHFQDDENWTFFVTLEVIHHDIIREPYRPREHDKERETVKDLNKVQPNAMVFLIT